MIILFHTMLIFVEFYNDAFIDCNNMDGLGYVTGAFIAIIECSSLILGIIKKPLCLHIVLPSIRLYIPNLYGSFE